MWFVIAVAIVIIICVVKITAHNRNKEVRNTAAQKQWTPPETGEEFLLYIAVMGEALSAFDNIVDMYVSWTFSGAENDKVNIEIYGIDVTSAFQNTAAWKFLNDISEEGSGFVNLSFEYERFPGAPTCFKTTDDILEFVSAVAPHAYFVKDTALNLPLIEGFYTQRYWYKFRDHSYADVPKQVVEMLR